MEGSYSCSKDLCGLPHTDKLYSLYSDKQFIELASNVAIKTYTPDTRLVSILKSALAVPAGIAQPRDFQTQTEPDSCLSVKPENSSPCSQPNTMSNHDPDDDIELLIKSSSSDSEPRVCTRRLRKKAAQRPSQVAAIMARNPLVGELDDSSDIDEEEIEARIILDEQDDGSDTDEVERERDGVGAGEAIRLQVKRHARDCTCRQCEKAKVDDLDDDHSSDEESFSEEDSYDNEFVVGDHTVEYASGTSDDDNPSNPFGSDSDLDVDEETERERLRIIAAGGGARAEMSHAAREQRRRDIFFRRRLKNAPNKFAAALQIHTQFYTQPGIAVEKSRHIIDKRIYRLHMDPETQSAIKSCAGEFVSTVYNDIKKWSADHEALMSEAHELLGFANSPSLSKVPGGFTSGTKAYIGAIQHMRNEGLIPVLQMGQLDIACPARASLMVDKHRAELECFLCGKALYSEGSEVGPIPYIYVCATQSKTPIFVGYICQNAMAFARHFVDILTLPLQVLVRVRGAIAECEIQKSETEADANNSGDENPLVISEEDYNSLLKAKLDAIVRDTANSVISTRSLRIKWLEGGKC